MNGFCGDSSEECLVEVSKKISKAHPAVGHDFAVDGVHVDSEVVTQPVDMFLCRRNGMRFDSCQSVEDVPQFASVIACQSHVSFSYRRVVDLPATVLDLSRRHCRLGAGRLQFVCHVTLIGVEVDVVAPEQGHVMVSAEVEDGELRERLGDVADGGWRCSPGLVACSGRMPHAHQPFPRHVDV